MKKPVLVVMAAGMGSRYGGLKQIDPIDREGHIIMDFSIYDAVKAGFEKVVFIIKKENEEDFRNAIGDRLSKQIQVAYVFQDLYNLPEGYEVPEGRVKPWGTGHAVLSCIDEVDGPFAVINADDYYGSHAFKMAYDFLAENQDDENLYRYMMVGYKLENTLTDNGHVARGVCVTDEEDHLLKINERTHIEKHGEGTAYTEDDGATWTMLPEGRVKPWGTGHAVLSCIDEVDGPFAVINADDYYGSHAFKMAYDFLAENQDDENLYRYMMVGYKLENTLTDNGHVARGVCVTDEADHLLKINERTHIEKHGEGTAYTEDDGATWTMLPEGSTVSMNMWGFSASILKELKARFAAFLDENLEKNPLKCEYFLPFVVDELLQEKKATVKVLKSEDKWYGVTYKEDKPVVMAAVQSLKDQGLYPQNLWEENK